MSEHKMALPPQQFCVRWNSYHTNLQAVFPRLLLTEQFADVTLACESRQLRCHKLVLSACSAYLERLLTQNPCKHPIVLMRDMRFSEMQALVDFMYKGEVNVTQEELPSLLKSAEALQIRGLCSNDTGVLSELSKDSKDYALASDALVAHANTNQHTTATTNGPTSQPSKQTSASTNGAKKRKPEEELREVKEETVEEDGLYYGELHADNMEFNEDEEPGKPGSSLGQTSGGQFLRVKPESELFFQTKLQNLAKANSDYIQRLSKMNPNDIQKEFTKYGLTNMNEELSKNHEKNENDYYKSWLEQNGELEVSLLRASQVKKSKIVPNQKSEVELIPKTKSGVASKDFFFKIGEKPQIRRRGRPPIFKDKSLDIGESVLKADLDQFLEGKEVSSSGLSRKDLERVMMGKFNPNRRYSNEAMWAALMDVKKGGSIYRAAQTHKVPRKSLRNWMKRCHIKSSFPMPQQLKQFVENSKKQKEEFKAFNYPDPIFGEKSGTETEQYETEEFDADYAIANVQCQYDSPSDGEGAASQGESVTSRTGCVSSRMGDHTYDTRDEPPAFIIHTVSNSQHHSPQLQLSQCSSGAPYLEVSPKSMAVTSNRALSVFHVGDRSQVSQSHQQEYSINKRIRRSEELLREAADCVSRGSTFQTVSHQFNIPISTIRFFMARKGILPRRRRGRTTQASQQCNSPEPPFHMQHYKLPDMVALRGDADDN